MEEPLSEEQILQNFTDMVKGTLPNRVVTNFILIAEVVGSSANELSIATSDGMTPWLATGMLQAGMDMIVVGQDIFSDDDEESDS
jgi:hypothetical protein